MKKSTTILAMLIAAAFTAPAFASYAPSDKKADTQVAKKKGKSASKKGKAA